MEASESIDSSPEGDKDDASDDDEAHSTEGKMHDEESNPCANLAKQVSHGRIHFNPVINLFLCQCRCMLHLLEILNSYP